MCKSHTIFEGMKQPIMKPDMEPRELKDGSGWYVLVTWGDRPSQQMGGFESEAEAQLWIDHDADGWLNARFQELHFPDRSY
jgi:hypothetical protein